VRRLADGRVVHVQITTDRADDDLAGVKTDADSYVHSVHPPRLLGIALGRLLHPKRRVAGPHRVVLVGHGSAEQRHDPVAHHLVDRALEAVNRLHHVFEDGIEDLARLLGITICEQLHRALEIGEEHSDLLALALEGALGREDLLGKVLRGVGRG
jgi:hypothetical protein